MNTEQIINKLLSLAVIQQAQINYMAALIVQTRNPHDAQAEWDAFQKGMVEHYSEQAASYAESLSILLGVPLSDETNIKAQAMSAVHTHAFQRWFQTQTGTEGSER